MGQRPPAGLGKALHIGIIAGERKRLFVPLGIGFYQTLMATKSGYCSSPSPRRESGAAPCFGS
jgi:hypothetical protein